MALFEAWPRFLVSFLVNGFAAVLFVLVINHVATQLHRNEPTVYYFEIL